jgi:hypothetical protein
MQRERRAPKPPRPDLDPPHERPSRTLETCYNRQIPIGEELSMAHGSGAFSRLLARRRAFQRGTSAAAYFERLVRATAPAAVVGVTLVFLSKILWPPLCYAWWLVPLWAAFAAATLAARRELWALPRWRAAAMLDRSTGNRGLYMALEEAPPEDWTRAVRGGRTELRAPFPTTAALWSATLVCALAGVALLPDLRSTPARRGGAATPIARLAAFAGILARHRLAPASRLDAARRLLDRLARSERQAGRLSAEDWQALDGCAADLRAEAARSLRSLKAAQRRAAELRAELGEAGGAISENAAARLRAIAERVETATVRDGLRQAADAAEQGTLRPAERDRLVTLLAAAEDETAARCEQCRQALAAAGMRDEALMALLQGDTPGDAAGNSGRTDGRTDRQPDTPKPSSRVRGDETTTGRYEPERNADDTAERAPGTDSNGTQQLDAGTARRFPARPAGDAPAQNAPDGRDPAQPAPGASRPPPPGIDAAGVFGTLGGTHRPLTRRTRLRPRHSEVLKRYFEGRSE